MGPLRDAPLDGRRGGLSAAVLWAIVLAGGDGVRLRPLTRRISGDDRPKQYVRLLGSRSLLGQTLDRVARVFPPERTVVVTQRRHAGYLGSEISRASGLSILAQPDDRGTAAGILFPVQWISMRDPDATVAVFPSDHFILEEGLLMGCVAEAAAAVAGDPGRIVLLGATPSEADAGYGWIEPGGPLGDMRAAVYRVRRFWEKPSPERAERCFREGCLWNTLIFVARASLLLWAAERLLPVLHGRLARLSAFSGTEDEPWAIQQAYALAPTASFSRAILEAAPFLLAVRALPPLTWCDLGTPERVVSMVERLGLQPVWLSSSARSA